LYIKPKHYKFYPDRITKLTGIKKLFLEKNGLDFKEAYKILSKFITKNSLVISNGDDSKILDSNLKLNKLNKLNKKIYLLDFYQLIKSHMLFNKYKKLKFINTETIKKTLKLNMKSHNAKNDVKILYRCLKKINIHKKDIKKHYKFYRTYKI
jgi:hypothetical protein